MFKEVLIEVPCDLRFRDVAGSAIRRACILAMSERTETTFEYHVISAFNEAFNNIAKHGQVDGASGENVAISVRFDEESFELTINSFGAGYEGEESDIPEVSELPESGMGLHIMNAFMDTLRFTKGAHGAPNVVYMEKKIQTGEPKC